MYIHVHRPRVSYKMFPGGGGTSVSHGPYNLPGCMVQIQSTIEFTSYSVQCIHVDVHVDIHVCVQQLYDLYAHVGLHVHVDIRLHVDIYVHVQ